MMWQFKPNKNSIKINVKDREGVNYTLGSLDKNLPDVLKNILTYIQEDEIIALKGNTETIVYKSPKGRTLTKEWNHINVIFPKPRGLLEN